MTLWILDTDHISLWQREHQLISQRIAELIMAAIATTIITAEEHLRGRLDVIRRATPGELQVLADRRFRETLFFLNQIQRILDFSFEAERCYVELKQQRIRIGAQDLRIAAIARSVNGPVVTRNRRDFEQVAGLVIEDWTL